MTVQDLSELFYRLGKAGYSLKDLMDMAGMEPPKPDTRSTFKKLLDRIFPPSYPQFRKPFLSRLKQGD